MKSIIISLDKIISVSEILSNIMSYLKKRDYYSSGGHIIQNGFTENFCALGEEEVNLSFEFHSKSKLSLECRDEDLLEDLSNLLFEKHYSHNLKIEDAA